MRAPPIAYGIFGAIFGWLAGAELVRGLLGANPVWLSTATAVIGFVAGIIYGTVRDVRSAQRTQDLQSLAQQRELQFSADGGVARIRKDFSLRAATMSNVLRKEIPGASFVVGDLAIGTELGDGDDRETRWSEQTAAYFTSAVRFPKFILQPAELKLTLFSSAVGVESLDFPTHPDLSQHYHLSAVHAAHARHLFDDELLGHLRRHRGLRVASSGAALLIYRPAVLCEPAQIEGFIEEATQTFRLLQAAARRLQEARAAGLLPKSDPRAEAEKVLGLVGKIVRARLATHADVEAFVQQPPPRKLPANIRQYCEEFAPWLAVAVGAAFFLAGAMFAPAFAMAGKFTGALVGLVFLVVGGVLLFFFGRLRLRLERLLRHGRLAVGRIEGIERKGGSRVKVRFDAAGTSVQATCRVGGAALGRARKLMDKKKPAVLLYDPANPQHFVLAAALLTISPEYDE